MNKRSASITHILLQFLLQWLSIAVIVLNSLALNAARENNQGLIVAAEYGPHEYLLLVMGIVSLLAASFLLCLYLQIFFYTSKELSFSFSRRVLALEIMFALIAIAVWATGLGVVVSRYNEFSACKKTNISTLTSNVSLNNSEDDRISARACQLADAMIVAGFISITVWCITLMGSIYSLFETRERSVSDLFTIHSPYEDAKLGGSNQDLSKLAKQLPIMPMLKEKQEEFITKKLPPKNNLFTNQQEGVPEPLPEKQSQQQQQQQQEPLQQGDAAVAATKDLMLHQREPEQLKPALKTTAQRSARNWNVDFHFEPVRLDLMLPSTSELIGSKKKRRGPM